MEVQKIEGVGGREINEKERQIKGSRRGKVSEHRKRKRGKNI